MPAVQETVDRVRRIDVDQYRYGFETVIDTEKAPKGLSEDTIRFISGKKNEPSWMLEWRLEAYRPGPPMTPRPGGTDPADGKIAGGTVFESVGVGATFKEELKKAGVIFMPISEAIREHP